MIRFWNLVFAGVTSGAIYAVFALLLTTLFRVANVLNLAIGDFAMVGVFGTNYALLHGWPTLPAILVALATVALFAYGYDRSVLGSALRGRNPQEALVFTLLLTYALSFVIEGTTSSVLGATTFFGPNLWPGPPLYVGRVPIQRAGILVLGMALLSGGAFVVALRHSLRGKALAACGENPLGARVVGIRQPTYRRAVFMVMCVLAAVFGIVEVPLSAFSVSSGFALGLTGILAAAIAGFARPGQAVLLGLGVGLGEAFIGGYVTTQYADVLLDLVLLVIVLYSPRLLGTGIADGMSTGALASTPE